MTTSYTTYRDSVEKVKALLHDCVEKIAYKKFEKEKGYKVTSVLPGDNEEYTFTLGAFSGYIHTKKRKMYNLTYNEHGLTTTNISGDPSILTGIIEEIWNEWYNTFGENENIRGHPGEPPVSKEGGKQMISELQNQQIELLEDPSYPDLVDSIKDSNYVISMKLLGVEDPEQVIDPTVGHEMHHLFAHGDISVYYEDDTIALVKPKYNHELRRNVTVQQRSSSLRTGDRAVVVNDEELELAYVIGKDDTPIGLFAHAVDGTNLTTSSTVTADKIYNCMGFDKQYKDTKYAELEIGERMRVQGDLAIEYVSNNAVEDNKDNCYIPIDNHYIALTEGQLPQSESKTSEPITVKAPQDSVVNISHDEHENITLHLDEGHYNFYLLDRGLKPRTDRPNW